jgi:hypothetical protein
VVHIQVVSTSIWEFLLCVKRHFGWMYIFRPTKMYMVDVSFWRFDEQFVI